MKKPFIISGTLVVLALLWWGVRSQEIKREQSAAIAKASVRPAKSFAAKLMPLPSSPNAKAPPKIATISEPAETIASKGMTAEEFAQLIDKTDMRNLLAIDATTQRLRAEDPKVIARYFFDLYKRFAQGHADDRAQLLHLADSFQSDELLPLWKDVASRASPLVNNEEALLSSTEPSVMAKVIHAEIAMAIKNIGIIAYHQPEASDILGSLVAKPSTAYSMVFERANAYIALKEVDPLAAARTLNQLPDDDALRVFLKKN